MDYFWMRIMRRTVEPIVRSRYRTATMLRTMCFLETCGMMQITMMATEKAVEKILKFKLLVALNVVYKQTICTNSQS